MNVNECNDPLEAFISLISIQPASSLSPSEYDVNKYDGSNT